MNANIMLERRGLSQTFNKFKNHRIIAVCAPAGYGKTVAVTEWLAKDTRVKAIFSLDEYDNLLSGFCERFCVALLTCQPRNQTLSEIVSHPSFQNAPDEFTLRAVGTLSSRKQTVLVIDDLHLIHDCTILHLLLVSIKRLPKNFQIILISRYDLPPVFSELRLRGQLASIDTKYFIFSNDEIKALYNMRGNKITSEQANEINQQTHGWAMGINAFLLSGKDSFDVEYDYIGDFLQANLWGKWDDDTRDFMLRTSNLRELTPCLCTHMTGISNCSQFLEELVQKGVFIMQKQKGIYHYHHLFQQFLKRMTSERGEEFLQSLLDKEGEWHLSKQDFYSTFDCFLQGKNHRGIAICYGSIVGTNRKDFTLTRILPIAKHPEFVVAAKQYPFMLFLTAFCAFAEGRVADMLNFLDEYYKKHPAHVALYPDMAYTIAFTLFCDFRVPLSRVSELPKEAPDISNRPATNWTATMHMPMFHRSIRDYSELAIGDVVQNCVEHGEETGWMIGENAPLYTSTLIAGLLYEQGQLSQAHQYATKALAGIKSDCQSELKFCAMAIMVCVLDANDENDSGMADSVIQSISGMIEETKSFQFLNNFKAFVVRRAISAGDRETAASWLATLTSSATTIYRIFADITTARAFITMGQYDPAIILLKTILEMVQSFNRTLDIIDVRILLAIACWKKKRGLQNEALKHLEEATLVAYPYGYSQMFIAEGATLSSILYKLQRSVEQRKNGNNEYLAFIRMLYMKTRSISNGTLVDEQEEIKFTDKQKIVITMLCQGKRQKEIAEAMGIKQTTLRYHIESVYNKLGVSNVADAVAKINASKLLE